MKGHQIKAFLMTFIVFGTIGWFFMGRPGLNSINIIDKVKNLFSQEERSKGKVRTRDAKVGTVIDAYNGVDVYYNGSVTNVKGRNTTKDGYNLGLKYQCVEFAKRFYYEAYGHKMPDSYGHARDFYDPNVADGSLNAARGMYQYNNGSYTKPKKNDLVVIGPTNSNPYGHLFVVTKVSSSSIDFIQQNPGPGNPSRGKYKLENRDGAWVIAAKGVVGWLRINK